MSSVDLVTRHARATADACRRVRVPGVARDFVQNGSPAQQNKTSSVDKKKKDHDNKQALVILDEERDEEKDVLRDACMLRASAEVVMSKQQAELQFLEGKIAALENMERQNTTRNVSFWVEVFRSAGKDHVLRREGAECIQKAWRGHTCRRKLRYALVSITRCPACGTRAQIP